MYLLLFYGSAVVVFSNPDEDLRSGVEAIKSAKQQHHPRIAKSV
jgi:hypothetical protein